MVSLPSWPNFTGENVIDLKLDRIRSFLDKLGNPEKKIRNIIHVAGTNGKGSTIAFLRGILEESGYSVNCYTSPHLISFNERIRIKGKLISDEYLKKLSDICESLSKDNPDIKLTFFEGATILSILAFAENQADFNIFEVGLGGRLDATNVFQEKLASIITTISFDHQEFLGNRLEDIAKEKAGIIQSDEKVFVGKQEPKIYNVIKEVLSTKHTHNFIYDKDFSVQRISNKNTNLTENDISDYLNNLPLPGEHQKSNFILALKTYLEITNCTNIDISLNNVYWPGRITYLDNLPNQYQNLDIWVDGGHNQDAARALSKWIQDNKIDHVIIGMNRTKDISDYLDELSSIESNLYFTEMDIFDDCYKKSDISQYSDLFRFTYQDPISALNDLNSSKKKQKILICGSLYLVGEVMKKLDVQVL